MSSFLAACRGESQHTPPIWLMRQAGRYLPEYRKIRERRTMLEAVTTPDLAVEITLQPIRRFGFDAAILFSDLTVLFTPMGAKFDIVEGVGPVVEHPVRTVEDLARLRQVEPRETLGYVMETIRCLKRESKVPLIGFTGAPFTLASYLIEGGPSKDHRRTRALMYSAPEVWKPLMTCLAENVAEFLLAQIEDGADAVQLFDSWIGVLDEPTYREAVFPYMQPLFERLKPAGVPVIHFGTGTSALLPVMQEAGGDVIGVDWRMPLDKAAGQLKPAPLQGNLDPAVMLSSPEVIRERAQSIVRLGRDLPGHIFNLGHGIYPDTPLENVERLVEAVRSA